jgi:hypothetical protein
MKLSELQAIAKELGIRSTGIRKADLEANIAAAQAAKGNEAADGPPTDGVADEPADKPAKVTKASLKAQLAAMNAPVGYANYSKAELQKLVHELSFATESELAAL